MRGILKKVLCIILFSSTAHFIYAQKPNVVVIMADDIGIGDIGYYHRQRTGKKELVPTPNIDKLIREGMRFSDAHSPSSLCAPTRFSMMTGNYSYRNKSPWGVWSPNSDALIEPKFTTVARIAKSGGYHTAFFGKWGLGGIWKGRKVDYSKEEKGAKYYGFDYSLVLPQGIQNKPFAFYENQKWMKLKPSSVLKEISHEQTGYDIEEKQKRDRSGIGDSNWDPTLAGPILAKKAQDYIKNQVTKHPGSPFYMYYCSEAVHLPHTPPKEIDGVKIQGSTLGTHGDMIRELDVQVGMIVKALKKAGVYDNTLLIFTSDNGGLNKDASLIKAGHNSSNILKGKKGSIYEGGHRVPFIAVWTNTIKPNSESHEPIVGQDMVATISALAKQPLDKNKVMDSANLLPYFKNESTKPAHAYLMHESQAGPSYSLREGDWKLILKANLRGKSMREYKRNYDGKLPSVINAIALYNLKDNVIESEEKNLIEDSKYAKRIAKMTNMYKKLRETGVSTVAK